MYGKGWKMVRHSFTIDIIPMASDAGKSNITVKHIPVEDGNWGKVTRIFEKEINLALTGLQVTDLIPVAQSIATLVAVELRMAPIPSPEGERK